MRTPGELDAVVIGSGHNGLVAANLLADAGWDVLVLEAQDRPGGAVHSDRSLHPDYVTDWFSSFYPLAAASPVLEDLELDKLGPAVAARARGAGPRAARRPGGGAAPRRRSAPPRRSTSSRPVTARRGPRWSSSSSASANRCCARSSARSPPRAPSPGCCATLGTADLLRFARTAVSPVRRFAAEHFAGEGAPMLFAGNALHTDLSPEAAGSAIYGWLLCDARADGRVPGAGRRLVRHRRAPCWRGCPTAAAASATAPQVAGIDIADGRVDRRPARVRRAAAHARGARRRRRAGAVPRPRRRASACRARLVDDLDKLRSGTAATLKVNWALSGADPLDGRRRARGGHGAHRRRPRRPDPLRRRPHDGRMPRKPFVLVGQTTTADASRSPAGTESAWSYTHVPVGIDTAAAHARRSSASKDAIEAQAPGFRDLDRRRADPDAGRPAGRRRQPRARRARRRIGRGAPAAVPAPGAGPRAGRDGDRRAVPGVGAPRTRAAACTARRVATPLPPR